MTGLVEDAWKALVWRSEADRTCRSHNLWARVNLERDLFTVNETVFRAALRDALAHQDTENRVEMVLLTIFDLEERTADW